MSSTGFNIDTMIIVGNTNTITNSISITVILIVIVIDSHNTDTSLLAHVDDYSDSHGGGYQNRNVHFLLAFSNS